MNNYDQVNEQIVFSICLLIADHTMDWSDIERQMLGLQIRAKVDGELLSFIQDVHFEGLKKHMLDQYN